MKNAAGTATGTANFSGGTFTGVGTSGFYIGGGGTTAGATATLNIDGTAAVTASATGSVNTANATTSTVNLGGGTFTTPGWTTGTTNTTLNFFGGKLQANAATTSLGTFTNAINLYAGGGTIDTQGNTVTISQALQNPANSGVTSATVTTADSTTVFTAPSRWSSAAEPPAATRRSTPTATSTAT